MDQKTRTRSTSSATSKTRTKQRKMTFMEFLCGPSPNSKRKQYRSRQQHATNRSINVVDAAPKFNHILTHVYFKDSIGDEHRFINPSNNNNNNNNNNINDYKTTNYLPRNFTAEAKPITPSSMNTKIPNTYKKTSNDSTSLNSFNNLKELLDQVSGTSERKNESLSSNTPVSSSKKSNGEAMYSNLDDYGGTIDVAALADPNFGNYDNVNIVSEPYQRPPQSYSQPNKMVYSNQQRLDTNNGNILPNGYNHSDYSNAPMPLSAAPRGPMRGQYDTLSLDYPISESKLSYINSNKMPSYNRYNDQNRYITDTASVKHFGTAVKSSNNKNPPSTLLMTMNSSKHPLPRSSSMDFGKYDTLPTKRSLSKSSLNEISNSNSSTLRRPNYLMTATAF